MYNKQDSKVLVRLVERCRNGEQEAFAHLYNLLSKQVYFHAVSMLGGENDAGDILQEVMLRLYKSVAELRNPKAVQVFLYRTTYNCCIDLLRKRKAIPDSEELDALLAQKTEDSPEFIPEEYALNQERRDYILALVDELSPDLRAVLVMHYYNELSMREIAAVLDTNLHTAKSRLFRAKQALRRKFEAGKEGVVRAMSVPVLTQIFQSRADDLFTPQVSERVWQELANELSLGAATVAIAVGATGTTGATVAGTTATTVTLGTKILGAIAITAATAVTATLLGTGVIGPGDRTNSPADPNTVFSGPSPEEGIEFSPDEAPENGASLTPGETPASDDWSASNPLIPGSAEATTSAGSSEGSGEAMQPGVAVKSNSLRYPVGTALDEARILEDTGAASRNSDQAITVIGLDAVDTSRKYEYGVLLRLADDTEDPLYTVIIIVIE